MIKCRKCKGKMFVDRVFLSYDHLELYCIICGRREIYHTPEKFGKTITWIMQKEKERARRIASPL